MLVIIRSSLAILYGPSAYASGALVKCRKVGAANWGNSTKNEEYMALPEFTDAQIGAMRYAGIEVEVIDEKCWKGYEKKGMKTMFGKRYPNCVKKEDEIKNDDKLISEKKVVLTHMKVKNAQFMVKRSVLLLKR